MSDLDKLRSLRAQEEALRAHLAELRRDRSMMERWDDFMVDWGPIAWAVLLGGVLLLGTGLGLIAMYFGLVAFCVVTGTLIAGLVFAITR